MLELAVRSAWVRDLPVCFPGRSCVDQTPVGARIIGVMAWSTPASPAIAVACFALLGAAAVLVVVGLRQHRRGPAMRPWLAALIAALLLVGAGVARTVAAWFGTISAIYSDVYGEPSAPAPPSLTAAWPAVLLAGEGMVVLGVTALVVALDTAARRRRRATRPEHPDSGTGQ